RGASLNIQIGDLTARYNQLRKKNRSQHPVLDQILAPKTLSVEEVRARFLTTSRDAFLEYFVGDSSVFAFLILPDTLQILEMKKDFPLEARVREMRTGIYGYFEPESNLTYKNAARQYAAAATELYDKIFKPLEPFLPRQARLTIVPDGALGYIPFEALLEKMPENPLDFRSQATLIRSHTISYACSAGLLWEMKTQKSNAAPLPKVLAFAPSFGGDWKKLAENRGLNVNLRGNQLGPLKNNVPEIRAIKSQFAADLFEGAAATEARFRALAGKYSILHLATHGVVNDRMGDFSFLAFHEIKDDLENEWLFNREIYDLRLNADLVVLSACETGVGVFKRGEGIISLARGFSYAGAKSLVTSLWKVDDAGTKNLMEIFYRNLKNGQPKDEALRAAKLELIENPNKDYAPPFFWAAFIAIGDMRPLSGGN
ncbi:MAG: CHAT domain-containing protein, partial [Bacteroidetes bacterium]